MISDLSIGIFVTELFILAGFAVWFVRVENKGILHHLYLSMLMAYAVWIIPLILIHMCGGEHPTAQWVFDSITSIGAYTIPAIFLCISIAFVRHEQHFKKWMALFFAVPAVNVLVIFTNPLHHLQYEHFSIVRSEIVFGPYIYVTGGYSYLCLMTAVIVLLVFAIKNDSRLYWSQVLLLIGGALPPMIVNVLATFSTMYISITATPISFASVIILHGIAIYRGHLLDVKPIAIESVHDLMMDAFLILSESLLILSYNKRFRILFAEKNHIVENRYIEKKGSRPIPFFEPILQGIEQLKDGREISQYETIIEERNYIVKITPVKINGEIEGYIVIFRDVTELRKSMKQLEDSREKLIQQERLALLGQMTAGLAHNLKSPIMGAAGCVAALEALRKEAKESIGDDDVTDGDYLEMMKEAEEWLDKIDESVNYMAELISEIKGRAVSAISENETVFHADELFRSCSMLMEHELLKGKCHLQYDRQVEGNLLITGNMNTLIQAVNNLLSNAIYSQSRCGGGEIRYELKDGKEGIEIRIVDRGEGIDEKVKNQLFRSMVTTKGGKGTGLGLYISDMTIRENYGGRMWIEDNEEKGIIAGIFIPEDKVIRNEKEQTGE